MAGINFWNSYFDDDPKDTVQCGCAHDDRQMTPNRPEDAAKAPKTLARCLAVLPEFAANEQQR
ncbi:hypothetical protein FY136_21890 [Agrobacterium tumefaciens]|uniref:hypothetical protein n=1 Tax=Agrobacterium tumefaciens TaxID=358 RepID=UPI0021CF3E14|nr:hypothetical protein [Agrobacterium tumefaciens]UXT51870.1 hypothetical protein FY136_21890 [Agrobacterium tumefaciens]